MDNTTSPCLENFSGMANSTTEEQISAINKADRDRHDGNYFVKISQTGGENVQSTGVDIAVNFLSDVTLLNKPAETGNLIRKCSPHAAFFEVAQILFGSAWPPTVHSSQSPEQQNCEQAILESMALSKLQANRTFWDAQNADDARP